MKPKNQNFEEIISESQLLDSEMEALRGGANGPIVQCGGGVIYHCNIGTEEPPPVTGPEK